MSKKFKIGDLVSYNNQIAIIINRNFGYGPNGGSWSYTIICNGERLCILENWLKPIKPKDNVNQKGGIK